VPDPPRLPGRAPASDRGWPRRPPVRALGATLEDRGWDELVRWYGSDLGYQPWRCLWRGSSQMTMTRPCRRMTRHLLQIRLTLGLTFTVCLNS
jgi:hypothetical protein